MNIFQIYVGQIHLISLVLVGMALLIAMFLTRGHPFLIRIILSLMTVVLGHFVYEDAFIWIMGFTGRDTGALKLFLLVTLLISICMYIMQNRYSFLQSNGLVFSIFLCTELVTIFTIMWMGGWFHALQLWYTGNGPDPHEALWAFSKIIGFLLFVPLLRGKE